MIRFFVLSLCLVFSIAPSARAQDAGTQGALPDVPQALEMLVQRGAQIRYLGRAHGLDGWIAIYQGQEQYYYVTPDQTAFVTGLMFGADGRPITVEQVQTLQSQGGEVLDLLAQDAPPAAQGEQPGSIAEMAQTMQNQTPSERLFREVESSNWIALGNEKAPTVYSFIDPQCPHCHDMIKALRRDYIDTGKLQLRIIPVGFQQGSLAQASFLLAAPDAVDRFWKHLDGDAAALPAKSDVSTQAIQKNMALMQAWRFNVTPLSLYRAKDGTVKIIRGTPKDIPALMVDLPPAS